MEVEKIREQFRGLEVGMEDKHGASIKVGDRLRDEEGEGEVVYLPEHASFVVLADKPHAYHNLESGNCKLKNTEIVKSP